MAIKKHTEGSLVVMSGISHITVSEYISGTLTVTINTGDTSSIGTAWEAAVELGKGWEISAEMNYNPTDPGQALMMAKYLSQGSSFPNVQFYEDATGVHAGTALLTSAVITKSMGSVDKISVTLKGDGTLGYT